MVGDEGRPLTERPLVDEGYEDVSVFEEVSWRVGAFDEDPCAPEELELPLAEGPPRVFASLVPHREEG